MKFKTKYNIGDIVEFETINTKKRMVGKIDSLVVKCSFEAGTDVVYYIRAFEFGTPSHISTMSNLSIPGTYTPFTCDVCGREVFSFNIVNGMKFCAKCYQEIFNNQQKYFDGEVLSAYEDLNKELECKKENVKLYEKITELQKQLEEKEKIIEHWHNLYKKRDQQFQSVRQRYHLLNKLQSNYNKKDKLHLLEMQCLELVKENEKLQKQLEEKEKIIQMQQNIERYDIGEMLTENTKLRQQLKTQPAEIIDEIKKQMDARKLEYISHLTKKTLLWFEN